jgi:hypothetical protein
MINDPLGVLSADVPFRSADRYDVGDGWTVIMTGEEIRRAKDLRRVAITRGEITFGSEEQLKSFLDILRDSDARLSKVPDAEVVYDWQLVRRKDLTVRFGVSWYDDDFYQKRRNAYLSRLHGDIFARLGLKAEDLRIEHIPL